METTLLILGYLLRHDSLHGYRLMQLLDDDVSELASVKMPTLYYQLEKLERQGLVSKKLEQQGNRPERAMYSITEEGKKRFIKLLDKALASSFEMSSLLDIAFYFGDAIPNDELISRLRNKLIFIKNERKQLIIDRDKILARFNTENDQLANAITRHKEIHLVAEISWLEETIKNLRKD